MISTPELPADRRPADPERDGALSLLEVLPAPRGDGGTRRYVVSLDDTALAVHLSTAMARLQQSPAELLCAALALSESRLTGAPGALATLAADGGMRQGWVDVADSIGIETWCRATSATLAVSQNVAAVPWCVLDKTNDRDGSASAAIANSCWRLILEAPTRLEVDYSEPLGDRGVAILADATLRALIALLARNGLEGSTEAVALSTIDIVDPVERAHQLVDWNQPTIPGRGALMVHRRFAQICAKSPDAVAVVDRGQSLRYAELDRQSRRLAACLRAAGIGIGDIVGIGVPRSAAAIVALLATLRVGAAYLPLDTALPVERLALMINDARVRVALVSGESVTLAAITALRLLDVDVDVEVDAGSGSDGRGDGDHGDAAAADISDIGSDPMPAAENAAALAYVMFTSGSTGTPKGVEIPHRAIIRLVCDVDYADLGADRRWLHAAPLGFDASTLEIWGALLNGGCVVVHDEALPTGAGLAATIAAHRVTSAWLTAALFNAVVDDDPQHLGGLRELITGGEALSVTHVRRMLTAAPGLLLHNGYGPTECTTFACTQLITAALLDPPSASMSAPASIPIGCAIAETTLRVLNARRQLLPVGVLGELYIGGAGLARGYLGRDALTAECFVADPFASSVADEIGSALPARLYRTGDLVRRLADGAIDFVGRRDNQVKIRGYRIEPGEIEVALGRHRQVTACAVLARADRPGERQLVAYVVADGEPAAAPALRAFLALTLPEFMLPARYVMLDRLPVTANGKLDRRALPAPGRERPTIAAEYAPPVGTLEGDLCAAFAELLDIERVGRLDNFFELGGSSLLAVRLAERIAREQQQRFAVTRLFAQPTPAALALDISGRAARASDSARAARRMPGARSIAADKSAAHEPIAIIAMAGRFPGAHDVEAFWANLCAGRDSIRHFRVDELDPSISASDRNDPAYIKARGVVDGIDQFDAAFFGIGPREAELMDPQQRVFMELCWQCMERGGHAPSDSAAGSVTGVFAGMYNGSYFQHHVVARGDLIDRVGAFQVMLGNEKDYIATRVAHKLDLTGPAVSVHTACSTSLVAINQAVDSLRNGGCDIALAGGVSLTCPPNSGYRYDDGAMLSPDGRTRTFDADARGTVFSDGAAVVLLRRLSDAVADGDEIIALIRGGAINNDGGDKASFTAPSSAGQAAVIAMAHANAHVDARSISYVEAHGTATPLGDPIEIEGLNLAFRSSTDDVGFCRIGSVKSNIGHVVIAAGATGVIKTALALRDRVLPASLHFNAANPAIEFAGSPFVVNAAHSAWHREGDTPRRAGVSSFGVGGTNAHVVLEEAPSREASEPATGAQLLALSARTPDALVQAARELGERLMVTQDANLADIAWTLDVGRRAFAHRLTVVASTVADAAQQLCGDESAAKAQHGLATTPRGVVFLFPGQGAQYVGMGRALYASEPAFRAAFDACVAALDGVSTGSSRSMAPLTPTLSPAGGGEGTKAMPASVLAGQDDTSVAPAPSPPLLGERSGVKGRAPAARVLLPPVHDAVADITGQTLREAMFGDDVDALLPTSVMQPAMFAIEYALARLWMANGVQPLAMIGHSVGEFVAATLAGVFALDDAIRLVARRGALMQAQPAGAMLSVRASFDAIAATLPDTLSMAAENASDSCVIAGPFEAVDAFKSQLDVDGIAHRALRTSHAFHASMMDAAIAPFRHAVGAVTRRAPSLPIVSTLTGDWLTEVDAMSVDHWVRHLREPVRFAAALDRIAAEDAFDGAPCALLEVGPRATLAALARRHPGVRARKLPAIASLDASTDTEITDTEIADVRRALGQLWCAGVAIAPSAFDQRSQRRRVQLPTYPFQRKRHWVEAASAESVKTDTPMAMPTRPVPRIALAAALPILRAVAASAPPSDHTEPMTAMDRKPRLIAELKTLFDDVAGFDLDAADASANFIELGLDSLMLTQVALQVQKSFAVKVSFRQLMGECASLDKLADRLDRDLPADAVAPLVSAASAATPSVPMAQPAVAMTPGSAPIASGDILRHVIDQQMALMAQQLALLSGTAAAMPMTPALSASSPHASLPLASFATSPTAVTSAAPALRTAADDEETALAHTRYDVKKAFGAIARIDNSQGHALDDAQRHKLDAFIARYVARTAKSKQYTQDNRAHMADPRVVNGFKPLLKEMIYQIVIERSRGSQLWDIDGNQYVDALNGFGMSLFGWQPDFVMDAVRAQLDLGYEIGPQHPLAGEVSQLMCEVTGHDRAALCNTGSEAVLGALRIARTVTGRETVVLFNGAYHGIIDEMIVRGTRTLRAVPAAPGILRNTAEHVIVLDYGTPESLQIIRERAHEIAAVLVEPVQSRRPDFQPREFLHELRKITEDAGALLVFDEVVTGFRAHPGGAQAVFDIRADLATYGKVVGGGYPIGVIAGRRAYMDALDGGHWQYGDDSVPTVGVTYFAGTFVRHPLALAAARAVLLHVKACGPELQHTLNKRVSQMADELNAFCADNGAPIEVRHFASVWKTFFLEDHPLQDLLFAMMRSRGVHILDNFPCFFTTAHSEADFRSITDAFKASVRELQDAGFLPRHAATPRTVMDASKPPRAGARIGREPDGTPAWFVADDAQPGQYRRLSGGSAA